MEEFFFILVRIYLSLINYKNLLTIMSSNIDFFYLFLSSGTSKCIYTYIYKNIYTHSYTHTHTYTYVYITTYVFLLVIFRCLNLSLSYLFFISVCHFLENKVRFISQCPNFSHKLCSLFKHTKCLNSTFTFFSTTSTCVLFKSAHI